MTSQSSKYVMLLDSSTAIIEASSSDFTASRILLCTAISNEYNLQPRYLVLTSTENKHQINAKTKNMAVAAKP